MIHDADAAMRRLPQAQLVYCAWLQNICPRIPSAPITLPTSQGNMSDVGGERNSGVDGSQSDSERQSRSIHGPSTDEAGDGVYSTNSGVASIMQLFGPTGTTAVTRA